MCDVSTVMCVCDVQGNYRSFNIQADSDGETEPIAGGGAGGAEPGDEEEGKGGEVHSEEEVCHYCSACVGEYLVPQLGEYIPFLFCFSDII